MPASASSSVNARAVYCEPASEWWTNPRAVNSLSDPNPQVSGEWIFELDMRSFSG
jgi:hypothetical protein